MDQPGDSKHATVERHTRANVLCEQSLPVKPGKHTQLDAVLHSPFWLHELGHLALHGRVNRNPTTQAASRTFEKQYRARICAEAAACRDGSQRVVFSRGEGIGVFAGVEIAVELRSHPENAWYPDPTGPKPNSSTRQNRSPHATYSPRHRDTQRSTGRLDLVP